MQNEQLYKEVYYMPSCLHQQALNSNSIYSKTAPHDSFQHHAGRHTDLQAKVFKTQETNTKFAIYVAHPPSPFGLA